MLELTANALNGPDSLRSVDQAIDSLRALRALLSHSRDSGEEALLACVARYYIRLRRLREIDHHRLFGDPAWDILIAMFVAAIEERPMTAATACQASDVAPVVALRALGNLVDEGLVSQIVVTDTKRRPTLLLTPEGDRVTRSFLMGLLGFHEFASRVGRH